MQEYRIEFAGQTEVENGLYVTKRPNIPVSIEKFESIAIPGRDGNIYISEETREDIEIEIEFNFMNAPECWFDTFRKAKNWLLKSGRHILVLGDNVDFFYIVKKVSIDTVERVCYEIGKFSATFVCVGYEYVKRGRDEYHAGEVMYNPYYVSHPIYKITGEGVCTLAVNGNRMKANVGQTITIDTELMEAYREDGVLQNTEVSGDFEGLYLKQGENMIEISEGFLLKVIPNWRCV